MRRRLIGPARGFALLASLLSLGWFVSAPTLEAAGAACASLCVMLGLYVADKPDRAFRQHQEVGDDSIGIQTGGDVTIGGSSGQDRRS